MMSLSYLDEVHLQHGRSDVTPARNCGRAFPLGQADLPSWLSMGRGLRAHGGLASIIREIDVGGTERYKPHGSETFCNVYAYDICCLAGVYLPRVWWTSAAIEKLTHGVPVGVRLGDTVIELNSNSLVRWFNEFGKLFGWCLAPSVEELRRHVSDGALGVICARSTDVAGHGHISIVVPESAHVAVHVEGRTTALVDSHLVALTSLSSISASEWWHDERFAEVIFPYWISADEQKAANRRSSLAKSRRWRSRVVELLIPGLVQRLCSRLIFEQQAHRDEPLIPKILIQALVNAEDRRFFQHVGFDVVGICRALVRFAAFGNIEGASTIEQQLVRTLLQRYQFTSARKATEIMLAVWASANVSKSTLAEIYLRNAYFGWRMNGIDQVCNRLRFELNDLTLRQACQIVAALKYPLPKEPSHTRQEQWLRRSMHIERLVNRG
jgi:hypothetical protein